MRKKKQTAEGKRAFEQAKARDARLRRQASADMKRRAALKPRPEYHKCATCKTPVRVEFKRCRMCARIRIRPEIDAMERRLHGSFESGDKR